MMVPAGFWRRYAAWSLDAVIVGVPATLVAWPYSGAGIQRLAAAADTAATRLAERMIDSLRSAEHPLVMVQAWLHDAALRSAIAAVQTAAVDALTPGLIAFVAIAAPYWILCEGSRWQATPGKRALGLVVAGPHEEKINFNCAAARHAAGALSWLTLNLGHALAALPPSHRALHDRIASTRVLAPDSAWPRWALAWLWAQAGGFLVTLGWSYSWLSNSLDAAIARVLG